MAIPQYNQDQMWQIYEKLPEELKQAVFSAENADHTFAICERHEIEECPQVASLIGLVLMGVMLPRDFEAALVKDMGLDIETAQRVTQEINRFIFFPVKEHLEQIHRKPGEAKATEDIGVATPRHSARVGVADQAAEQTEEEDGYIVEEPAQSQEDIEADREPKRGPDTYREPLE